LRNYQSIKLNRNFIKNCYRIAAIRTKILKNQWLHFFLSMGEAWGEIEMIVNCEL
jgi:hypothetical protein